MNDVEKPHEIEYLEAQVQAAQNGQTAAMAQAETWKTTAEFYRDKASVAEDTIKGLSWALVFTILCILAEFLLLVIYA